MAAAALPIVGRTALAERSRSASGDSATRRPPTMAGNTATSVGSITTGPKLPSALDSGAEAEGSLIWTRGAVAVGVEMHAATATTSRRATTGALALRIRRLTGRAERPGIARRRR